MSESFDLETWLRDVCREYRYALRGVFQTRGELPWPQTFDSEEELEDALARGGHLLPLPKEPASLANVLEVGIVDFILDHVAEVDGLEASRGTERGYPDLELTGEVLGGAFHAVDIKVARRKKTKSGYSKNTDSRITLYTGNTYFRYPKLPWPGTFRPFEQYVSHLDVLGIYSLNAESTARVEDLELIVQPSWKIASKQRSSTTREYIGAVVDIEALREGRGEFATAEEFYAFWRKFPFKIGRVVQQQLDKLIAEAGE